MRGMHVDIKLTSHFEDASAFEYGRMSYNCLSLHSIQQSRQQLTCSLFYRRVHNNTYLPHSAWQDR